MSWRWLALLALAGCGAIIGIEDPIIGAEVTGRLVDRTVVNGLDGATTVDYFPVPGDVEVSVVLADGSTPEVTLEVDGTFTFLRRDEAQPYKLMIASGGRTVEYQLALSELVLGDAVFARRDAVAPSPGTALVVQVEPRAGSAAIATTGVWSETRIADAMDGEHRIDWPMAGFFSPPGGLLSSTRGDRAFFTRLTTDTGRTVADEACELVVEMFAGQASPSSCSPAPLALDRCADLELSASSERARLLAAAPAEYDATSTALRLVAQPVAGMLDDGFLLAQVLDPATDGVSRQQYAQPYPGHVVTAQLRVTIARPPTLTLPFPPAAYALHAVPAPATCDTLTRVEVPVAVPGAAAIDGALLATDGQVIVAATDAPLELAWSVVEAGPVDLFRVRLYAAGATPALELVHEYVSLDQRVEIDPAGLAPARTYVVILEAERGIPGAAGGDLLTTATTGRSIVSIPTTAFTVAL